MLDLFDETNTIGGQTYNQTEAFNLYASSIQNDLSAMDPSEWTNQMIEIAHAIE